MSIAFRFSALVAILVGPTVWAKARLVAPNAPRPAALAAQADVVLIGKVVEIEKETVEAPAFAGASPSVKVAFKVAVVKITEPLIGGKGLTQYRVGFPADAAPAVRTPPAAGAPGALGRVVRSVRTSVALEAGMEGCFFLSSHPGADFYVVEGGAPLDKKSDGYAKQLEEVRKVARALEDPVAALKGKDLADRFHAATAILNRYQASRPGRNEREAIPAEENRLILDLLLELPWAPAAAGAPSRTALWPLVRPAELGFRQPKVAGGDYNQIMGDATTAFLKENKDKLKIRRYAD
jgi:hypothetical protein